MTTSVAIADVARDDDTALLQRAVEEAARLLSADGAMVYLADAGDGRLHFAVDAGIRSPEARTLIRDLSLPIGVGVFGHSVARREVIVTGDYRRDRRFTHSDVADRIVLIANMRSMAAAPLLAGGEVLGALGAYSSRIDDFDEAEIALLRALADHAAAAIWNRRLIERLNRSQQELARRVEAEQTLGLIAARIAAIHVPDEVLQEVVDAARRLLSSDSAHLTILDEQVGVLRPTVVAGTTGPQVRAWLQELEFPINEGINGLAAGQRQVTWTSDYLVDPRIPHEPTDQEVAEQLGLRGMAAAPLRAPGGAVIGTLAVSFAQPRAFADDELNLLQGLADQGAIAIANARLYRELQDSEARYRFLVDNSPDMIWSCDVNGRFTFMSESIERIFGLTATEAIGRHWRELTDEDSIAIAQERWERMQTDPSAEQQMQIVVKRPDGGTLPVDIHMVATTVDGRFAGAHGALRDVSERERLESDLRRQAAELAASGERAHLARELHDSVTQALFSIGLTLRSLELQLQTDPDAARGKLAELRELQRDALAEMRTLIFELRPASLETDGLAQALRTHAAAVQGRTGLAIALDVEPMDRLPLPVEEALYRIGQEALHNVVKHANAQRADIRLVRDGELVRLSVEDDGEGFDPDAVPRGHLGLIGMRQRADLIGAEMDVRSQAGQGTAVEICVPAAVAWPPEPASVN